MSDKKFNFLNNLIECIITTVILPTGKGSNQDCQCLNDKPPRSFKQVNIANSGHCLFYALELAREYSDSHKIGSQASPQKAHSLRQKFTRLYKNHEIRLKNGVEWLLKTILGNSEISSETGCDITLVEKVFIILI